MTREDIDALFIRAEPTIGGHQPQALELLNTVFKEAKLLGYDEILPAAHFLRADVLRHQSLLADSQREFEIAVDLSRKQKQPKFEGKALNGLGIIAGAQNNLIQAKELHENAIAIAREIGDRMIEGQAFSNLAQHYMHAGFLELAVEHARQAYLIQQGTPQEPQALQLIGVLTRKSGDNKAALEIARRVLELQEHNRDISNMPYAYNHIGTALALLGNYTEAKENFRKGIEIAREWDQKSTLEVCLEGLGTCELEESDFDTAAEHLKEAYEIASSHGLKNNLIRVLNRKAELELLRNQAQLALPALNEACELMEAGASHENERAIYSTYSRVYEALGNWKSALDSQRKAQAIQQNGSADFKYKINMFQKLFVSERERHEKEIAEMRASQLEKELANSAMHLAAQTELLGNFRNELRHIVREIEEPIEAMKKIKEKLKELPCESIDWAKFEAEFLSVHPEFVMNIKERFPLLTKQEIKMCQLARLGLKNYEMSRLLCLSERTIETHRRNLRKKMSLKADNSLTKFLEKM